MEVSTGMPVPIFKSGALKIEEFKPIVKPNADHVKSELKTEVKDEFKSEMKNEYKFESKKEDKKEEKNEVFATPLGRPARKSVTFKAIKPEDMNFMQVLTESRTTSSLTDGYKIIIASIKYFLTGNKAQLVVEPEKLLTELTKVTSLLDGFNEPIISELFKAKLLTLDDKMLSLFLNFVVELARTNTFHYFEVSRVLVSTLSSIEETDLPDGKLAMIHAAILQMLKELPQFNETLIKQIGKSLPYMTRSWVSQVNCYKNMLRICDYMPKPEDRLDILSRLIHKIIDLDCHCPKEELLAAEDSSEDQVQFNMDGQDMDVDMTNGDVKTDSDVEMKHKLGNTFDRIMDLFFDYIDEHLKTPEESKIIFKRFLVVFDKYILSTYKCLHIQFLVFYICSKKPLFSDHFIDVLWHKVSNPNTSVLFRQISCYYIGSMLCRGKFIAVGTLKDTLTIMCRFLHNYLSQASSAQTLCVDTSRHATFYAVCQTVTYCVAFRHKEIVESTNGLDYLRSLNLESVITSALNPLKVMSVPIVSNFANVSRHYQIVYCHSIIERNNRSALPMANMQAQTLEAYFPYDPYVLLKSKARIEPIYREYVEYLSPKEDEEESDDDDGEEEGEEDMATSYKSNSAAEKMFAYSVSPGFVH